MPSFAVVADIGMDYAADMATVGDVPRPRKRPSQDETTPFLLEFVVAPNAKPNGNRDNRGRRSQDETAPFPLMLEALRLRKKRVSQDETSPFLLTLAGEPEPEAPRRAARRASSSLTVPALTLPALTWRGLNASSELRAYAARVASGEDLPPYSGPILASDQQPSSPADTSEAAESHTHAASERAPESTPPSARRPLVDTETTSSLGFTSSTSAAKVVLGLMLMLGALVASATAGDDATLRAAGQSVSGWFSGGTPSYEPPAPAAPVSGPAQTPCVTAAPALAR